MSRSDALFILKHPYAYSDRKVDEAKQKLIDTGDIWRSSCAKVVAAEIAVGKLKEAA